MELGTPEQIATLLGDFSGADGHARFGAVAWSEPGPNKERAGFVTTATPAGDGYVITGKKTFIINAPHAGRFLVFAQVDMSLEMDRKHEVSELFLRNFMKLAGGRGGQDIENFGEDGSGEEDRKARDPSKVSEANRTSAVGTKELAWADAAMVLCMPGAGLGGLPVKSRPSTTRARSSARWPSASAARPTSMRATS